MIHHGLFRPSSIKGLILASTYIGMPAASASPLPFWIFASNHGALGALGTADPNQASDIKVDALRDHQTI
jgi:hypothetical protein